MIDRGQIKAEAKEKIRGHLGELILIGLLGAALTAAVAGVSAGIGGILILPLTLSMNLAAMTVFRGGTASVDMLFTPFKTSYARNLGAMLWKALWLFLWGLVPVMGIVKAYAYSMQEYILMDDPTINYEDSLNLSKKLTEGHKWQLFVFDLSFLGWFILSVLTCGILGLVYVGPYYETAKAGMYDAIRAEAAANGRI